MDTNTFRSRMREIDDKLAGQKVPGVWRPFSAWFLFTGKSHFQPSPPDPSLPEFEDPNLYHQIEGWYREHYPEHSVIQELWGFRWFAIRGEFFRALIPTIFNRSQPLNPFEFLEGISSGLMSLLSERERQQIDDAFNAYFRQASDINLCLTVWNRGSRTLTNELIERGWSDLRDAGNAFRTTDPTSILFSVQQASEKYLKAALLSFGVATDETELRLKYGHNIRKLFNASETQIDKLSRFRPQMALLEYDAAVRYRHTRYGAIDVLARMNLSYALCHTVARSLLDEAKDRSSVASFESDTQSVIM